MDADAILKKDQRRSSLKQRNLLLSMRLNQTTATNGAPPQARVQPGKGYRNPGKVLSPIRNQEMSPGKRPTLEISELKNVSPINQAHKTGKARAGGVPLSKLQNLKLADFEIGKVLGKGKFGRVYCVRHIESGFVCALKAMEKKDIIQYNIEKQFRREVEIQSSLRHPNLTQLYGYFHDEKRVYLLMEYLVNGELYKHLKGRSHFNDVVASYYVYQMADALDYMHERNILHRDIKPENIIIGFNNTIKLTDFGWSVITPKGSKRKTLCGTVDYLSPELIRSREYNEKVDVWALGVLTYELLVGSPPFEEESKELTYKRILKRNLIFPDHVDTEARHLISRLLEYDPGDRIPLKEVKKHPWIEKNKPFW
ncbi:AFL101Cp [Eremothecium gossypii ATCC 10895]|uniref:Aurora kinase n=1 Tax=Eremothecium gossypii (strain ATCC 10895 / CBS 109.51 / FGSC 9923 / NRRL Y-1056) TaxID=284811 RepID=AURK_EREGS|nr:AFL101Cp [Eremothecium gossypii ATCC 10895]Q755C4.1 RecName: Full=Spindle assembly checkpoint kinase; AltName: Full=Aurora kinase [Eremothecium gossypii ATCC 10895]AAS53273.1 AFL101Cp [Eremothecium gossypii ATCC 10895]AEY97583.1 FAFL101Cp [Eremothecium gossypii FDAG1]